MASSERKRVFRKARGAEEEKKLLESSTVFLGQHDVRLDGRSTFSRNGK